MHYLGSNSCHAIVGPIFLIKYICAWFFRQQLEIASSILKQQLILEYHIGVYQKGGSNAIGRNSIFDVSHDYVKKVVPERKQ